MSKGEQCIGGPRLRTRRGVRGALVALCALGVFAANAAPALAGAPEAPELRVEAHVPSPASPATEALLYGVLNPNAAGVLGKYEFLYKASQTGECEGGSHAPASPGIALGEQHEELPAETIAGLTPGTEYAVCLLAETSPTERTLSPAVTFTTAVTPEAPETSPATLITATTATFEGTLNPHAMLKAGSYFEYNMGPNCSGGTTTEPEAEATVEAEAVSREVTELQPNAEYSFCLVATNEAGEATASANTVHFTTLTSPPTVESLSTPSVSSVAVGLEAVVNPDNQPVTACVFEYGETSSYGNALPCESASIAGFGGQSVTASVTGLASGTGYDYRVRVRNAAGESERVGRFATNPEIAGPPNANCPNPSHTGLSGRLPDCRAYELVTPPNKEDSEDMFGNIDELSVSASDTSEVGYPDEDPAEEGDKFFLTTSASFGPNPAAGESGYVFSRGPSGWGEISLAPPGGGAQTIPGNPIFNSDFSDVAITDEIGSQGDKAAMREAGYVGPPGGPYLVGPPRGPREEPALFESLIESGAAGKLVGASADFSRIFFQSREHGFAAPAEEQRPESNAVYEYADGHYSLVNVEDDGKPTSECGAISPASLEEVGVYAHAVSSDGSRVLFLSPDPANRACYIEHEEFFTGTPPQLYLRAGGHTIEISAPETGVAPDPEGPQPVAFAGASADDSRVFFITRAELTANDAGNFDPELYEYDVETEKLTRVSSGDSGSAVGNVGWVVPAEDGSTVYFTATGTLAPGAPTLLSVAQQYNGQETQVQEYNLYRYDTATATTTFIATVSGQDWYHAEAGGTRTLNIRQPSNVRADWQTTPDGQYLLFDAVENITGYDSHDATGHCAGNIGGTGGNGNCAEVYRYNAADNSTICVSCNPSGAAPSANALFDNNTRYREVRAISNDGAYVFFDTREALVPTATDERVNVYEWHEGAISLISSGQDASSSYFLGTDASGADVFFGTHAQLVPQDTDTSGDLYDARIDGGFPVSHGSAVCEGDACQSPPPPGARVSPSSLLFSGAGNLPPAPPMVAPKKASKCKKGFVRKKNKCVKSKKKASKARRAARGRRAGR